MELKDRIIRDLEWSNKRLKLIGKGLDEEQIEIIEFSLLHDLLQLTLTDVGCRKLNEWIKIDPTKANTIPEEPVWIMTIDRKEIEYKEADEYIELNYASHYRLIDEPEPPL